MKIEPVGSWLLIESVSVFANSKLVVPEGDFSTYKVIAAGPGETSSFSNERQLMNCCVGDIILVHTDEVLTINKSGVKYLLVRDNKVIAKIH